MVEMAGMFARVEFARVDSVEDGCWMVRVLVIGWARIWRQTDRRDTTMYTILGSAATPRCDQRHNELDLGSASAVCARSWLR